MEIPRKSTRLLGVILFFTCFGTAALMAQESCENAVTRSCQDAGETLDTSDDCLAMLYACGEYKNIVGRFTGVDVGLRSNEEYFIGLAYLGVSNGERANSLKCYYNRKSRRLLENFLQATL